MSASWKSRLSGLAAVIGALSLATTAQAQRRGFFVVDPGHGVLAASGTVAGVVIEPQGPGSLVTS